MSAAGSRWMGKVASLSCIACRNAEELSNGTQVSLLAQTIMEIARTM